MPLPPPVEREPLHTRRYHFEGFQRSDGLWDIEGRIVDTKHYAFDNQHRGSIQPGEPLHEMAVRLTLDDDFVVRDIAADTTASPFAICPGVTPNYRNLIGARVGPGWRKALRQAVGGAGGCTHITEMLGAMGTVAYQTYVSKSDPSNRDGKPRRSNLVNSCHAFSADGPLVKEFWPDQYTGE
ncbi:DUF2889 domain-containing protein [Fodinicurvata fenggangensis]|uniref:DUF2889 domain-containing protein n=1 Tax=Fodinicurvata fenggangensis TaxID=1121830 RepID=UPI00047ABF39|nr:DUF2889 domain-containing protein [Fodinicurvata fenggangensis]